MASGDFIGMRMMGNTMVGNTATDIMSNGTAAGSNAFGMVGTAMMMSQSLDVTGKGLPDMGMSIGGKGKMSAAVAGWGMEAGNTRENIPVAFRTTNRNRPSVDTSSSLDLSSPGG